MKAYPPSGDAVSFSGFSRNPAMISRFHLMILLTLCFFSATILQPAAASATMLPDPTPAGDIQPEPSAWAEANTLYGIQVNVWVYLEGAMVSPAGGGQYILPMRNNLNNNRILPGQCYLNVLGIISYTPAQQPYCTLPWCYPGSECSLYDSHGDPQQGDAGYDPGAVDWVLVSLRSTPTGPDVCSKAGLLLNTGQVVFGDPVFSGTGIEPGCQCYIVVEHRNHLIVMSPGPVTESGGAVSHDFRNAQSYIDDPLGFGGVGQKELLPSLPGVFAMYAGNGKQCGNGSSCIDLNFEDRSFWESQNATAGKYRTGDYNHNGDCNFNDRITFEQNNGLFSTVPVQ